MTRGRRFCPTCAPPKVDISLPNSVTVTYAFLTVLSAKRIPGGIVTISNCDEERRPGSKSDDEDQELRVQCKNVTLRELLNAIVRAHGYAVWAYSERHCAGRSEFRLDFIAR